MFLECVWILVIVVRQENRIFLLCILLSSVASYFSKLLINNMIFGKCLLNIQRVLRFFLQIVFETFLILRRTRQYIT